MLHGGEGESGRMIVRGGIKRYEDKDKLYVHHIFLLHHHFIHFTPILNSLHVEERKKHIHSVAFVSFYHLQCIYYIQCHSCVCISIEQKWYSYYLLSIPPSECMYNNFCSSCLSRMW